MFLINQLNKLINHQKAGRYCNLLSAFFNTLRVMILITGIILFIIFIIIPVCLGIQLFLADKSALKSFRNNLLPNQIVKIEFDNDIREARVIKATNSIVYVTLATGRKMAVLIEQVYPMNHFQDEQMPLEANNIKVA